MELFDKVNDKDEVIGVTTKKESHTKGYIHRLVAVFVFTSDGKLLVQKRKDDKKLDHSVGGHVLKGESYGDAATREAEEELGINTHLKRLAVFLSDETSRGARVKHLFALYESTVDASWKFLPTEEVDTIIPLSIPEVIESMHKTPDIFSLGFLNTMKTYCKAKNLPLPDHNK